jgi:hypothetical protein
MAEWLWPERPSEERVPGLPLGQQRRGGTPARTAAPVCGLAGNNRIGVLVPAHQDNLSHPKLPRDSAPG